MRNITLYSISRSLFLSVAAVLCLVPFVWGFDVPALSTAQYNLTTSANPPEGGTVSPSGTTSYDFVQIVPISATANPGYAFSSWSGDYSGTNNTDNPNFVIVNGQKNVVANFTRTAPQQFTLTTSVNPVGAGTVDGGGTYDAGAVAWVTAVPTAGYTFSHWSGDISDTNNPTSIIVNGQKNVVANFTQDQYTLAVNIVPPASGTVTKNPDKTTYVYGEVVHLTATAGPGFTSVSWSGLGEEDFSNENTADVSMNANRTITANFTQTVVQQYTLMTSVNPAGAGTVTKNPDKMTYSGGEVVHLTATANSDFTFVSWSGLGQGDISNGNTADIIMNRDMNVIGNFIAVSETVSTPTTPTGPGSGTAGTSYSYTTGGSVSNLEHQVEYQFDWKGDGTNLSPWGSATQLKTWSVAGTYNIRTRARCSSDTSVISSWSSALSVTVAQVTYPPLFSLQDDRMTYDASLRQKASEVGARWIRQYIFWSDIEPAPPTNGVPNYDWSKYDDLFLDYQNLGLTVIAVLGDFPSWAASQPYGPFLAGGMDHFKRFISDLVERYDGDGQGDAPGAPVVRFFEFFNEPDLTNPIYAGPGWGYWSTGGAGIGPDYAQMLGEVYPVVKAANPNAMVVLGGLALEFTVDFNPSFLDQILSNPGGGSSFDVMNLHYYRVFETTWNPYGKDILGKVAYVQEKFAQYSVPQKPIFVTEAGDWSALNCVPGNNPYYFRSEDIQAQYAMKLFVRSLTDNNIKAVTWFILQDVNFPGNECDSTRGLFRLDGSEKPASFAYETASNLLQGAAYVGPLAGVDEGYIFSKEGKKIYAFWNESGSRTVTLAINSNQVIKVNKLGEEQTIPISGNSYNLEVGQDPIYSIFQEILCSRDLPDYYRPSVPLSVAIAVTPSDTTQSYTVEDGPPEGWTATNINENGQWDQGDRVVRWGPFSDHNVRTLTYQVTPRAGETGAKTFSGTAGFDGYNAAITGDLTLEEYAGPPLPDLTGEWTDLTQRCKGAKCKITGTFKIRNIGGENAPPSFVEFYLSVNGNYNEGDTPRKRIATRVIKAGKNKVTKFSYPLPPEEIPSGKYVIAVIDADNSIEEIDKENNIITGPIQ